MAGVQSQRRLLYAAGIGVLATVVAVALWVAGGLNGFEEKTWDWRVRAMEAPGAASDQIALIMLDQASLDWGKNVNDLSWPWPRQIYAPIVQFCRRAGAKAVAFDVLFTEPSTYGVFDDQSFADAIDSDKAFVAAVSLGDVGGSNAPWPANAKSGGLQIDGLQRWLARAQHGAQKLKSSLTFQSAAFPIPEVTASAAQIGNVNLNADPDGVYRRGNLFSIYHGTTVPSLALAAYIAGNPGTHTLSIRRGALDVDGMHVPVLPDGSVYLRYRGPTQTYANYSAAAILQSELQIESGDKPNIDPSKLKGKYVFFGFTAPGLLDLRPAPVGGTYAGMEVHATMLDDLLSRDFIKSLSPLWVIVIALILALAASYASSMLDGVAPTVITYVIALPLAPALGLLAYRLGGRIPIVMPELGVVVSLVGSSIAKYVTEGRQKRYIKGAFRQYLSPAVIDQLIAHPERLKLGGERKQLSIFFSDLQGFTGLSEGLSPEELTALLNEYLSAMTDIIQDEGGTIDKYEGDAIIAFWNAPLDLPDHAVRAVRAALRCQARLDEMRPAMRERTGKDLRKRIGINTGPAVVGNMGSTSRFDYTMLGDAVNLASRLEGVNKQFSTYTMISAATYAALDDAFPARELSRIAVVGRTEPVTVLEPMTEERFRAQEAALRVFARGLAAYYNGAFADAASVFSEIADVDPPAAAYLGKCRELSSHPPEKWEGVWVMTQK